MKRKLKKKVKIFISLFLIAILSLVSAYIYDSKKVETKKEDVIKINYVSEVLKLENNTFDKDFLEWIDYNYDSVLEKLYESLSNNLYTDSFWHEETGNSFIVLNDLYLNKYENCNDLKYVDGM